MADFPPLRGEAKTGKVKQWRVRVEATKEGHGLIITEYGYEGGAVQRDEKVVEEGKNIGKKNETTPLQQAILEARSVWNKKKASGYVEAASAASAPSTSAAPSGAASAASTPKSRRLIRKSVVEESPAGGAGRPSASASASAAASASIAAGRASEITESVPLPMLAHKWPEKAKYVTFPCYVQPKFDGTRTVAVCGLKLGIPCLFSRQRKAYPHLEHIQAVVRQLPKGLLLDGELYRHDMDFQEIVGTVKKKTLTKADEAKHGLIQLHCYDLVDTEKPFEERFALLKKVFSEHKKVIGDVLVLCPTEKVAKKEDLQAKHDAYVADGYEGLMVRNIGGLYDVGNRSTDLLKMKEFQDDEFEIIGFQEGEGGDKGLVIWRCKTKAGKEFSCRPRGTHEVRAELFKHGKEYVGKMLTVRFQELTADGIPRFPVGIAVRDYE
jgi:ATP-dependent DNA ligase